MKAPIRRHWHAATLCPALPLPVGWGVAKRRGRTIRAAAREPKGAMPPAERAVPLFQLPTLDTRAAHAVAAAAVYIKNQLVMTWRNNHNLNHDLNHSGRVLGSISRKKRK